MARITSKKSTVRKSAKKQTPARRSAGPRTAGRRVTRAKTNGASATAKIRPGVITHTELASADPSATKAWCQKVLGWKFGEAMPTPSGPYHMWRFPNVTGGGIRANNPPEVPGSIPYCEVTSIQATYKKALENGATEMLPPQELPGGMGSIAIVGAPGGVPIGFWSMK